MTGLRAGLVLSAVSSGRCPEATERFAAAGTTATCPWLATCGFG